MEYNQYKKMAIEKRKKMGYYINRKMKNKLITRAIFIVITAALSVTLIMAATSSWYISTMESTQDFIVEADGVLYLYVPASVEGTGQTLYPAKAMPQAVSNGLYMDPLIEYDQGDANPSYVSQTATIADYSSRFIFYNEYRQYVQETDESGDPVYDESGDPVYVQATDSEGEPLYDEQGDPIYLTEPTPAILSYNLAIKDTPNEENDDYIDIDEIVIKEFYFSYDEDPIPPDLPINEENGALEYLDSEQDKTSGTVRVEGTVEIYIHMQIYLANVDELMDPAFSNTDFYMEIELSVMPEVQ